MRKLPQEFDDIRPYYDLEIPSAMKRIAADPLLNTIVHYLGCDEKIGTVKELLYSIRTTDQFQELIMNPLIKEVISKTISSFSFDGIEHLNADESRLFISNHRDIVLDASLLQVILKDNNIPTSQITFGSNLMHPQFVVDIGMSNKMFKTVRKSFDAKSFLKVSRHLYSYINYVVQHGESVWIAQRNGRTKDGLDRTEPGLLRMITHCSNEEGIIDHLKLTPVSVSYQWEPCDILKSVERYKSMDGKQYVKSSGEDLNSIITGITSKKGNVHISIRKPMDGSRYGKRLQKEDCVRIASDIDSEIYAGYKLWDTNYVAYDIINNTNQFSDGYTMESKEEFISYMNHSLEKFPELNRDILSKLFLQIYAGPVYNCRLNDLHKFL